MWYLCRLDPCSDRTSFGIRCNDDDADVWWRSDVGSRRFDSVFCLADWWTDGEPRGRSDKDDIIAWAGATWGRKRFKPGLTGGGPGPNSPVLFCSIPVTELWHRTCRNKNKWMIWLRTKQHTQNSNVITWIIMSWSRELVTGCTFNMLCSLRTPVILNA